jgi:sigma-B regulation protein RsbU (phosphoserine phosphatase)
LLKGMVVVGDQIGHFVTRRKLEAEREQLVVELQDAMANVKLLRGLLPICATCKNIRDSDGRWYRLEDYFAEHSEARFTHGICPDCARKIHPDWDVDG